MIANALTVDQKFEILQQISDLSLKMRSPGSWYVDCPKRYIGGDGFLRGAFGNGKTPQEAIENDFSQIVTYLPNDRYIVIDDSVGKRKNYKFNGYIWKEVKV